jgi:hypothetical protein
MIDPPWSLPVGFFFDYAPMEHCALLPIRARAAATAVGTRRH